MAENNSSAPLLPCPFCGGAAAVQKESPADNSGGYFVDCNSCRASTNLRYACGDNPVPLLMERCNARAPQAVAAQAAPAAVAVPPLTPDEARWAAKDARQKNGPSDPTQPSEYVMAGALALAAKLAATPEHPPTEDSSAGDLAEASHQTKLLAQALGDCILASGIVRSDLDMSGPQLLMFAEDLKELLLAGQAEVQAEPVAWANWKVGSTSYVPYRTRTQAQASVSQSAIAATQEGPYEVVPLYTAPQAQPADAPYPPLPATEVLDSYVSQRTGAEVYVDGYTADQMHAYIDLDRAAMAAAQEGGNAAKEA